MTPPLIDQVRPRPAGALAMAVAPGVPASTNDWVRMTGATGGATMANAFVAVRIPPAPLSRRTEICSVPDVAAVIPAEVVPWPEPRAPPETDQAIVLGPGSSMNAAIECPLVTKATAGSPCRTGTGGGATTRAVTDEGVASDASLTTLTVMRTGPPVATVTEKWTAVVP